MKLVEILARELEEWPEDQDFAWQDYSGEVRFNFGIAYDFFATQIATDNIRYQGERNPKNGVTKDEWLAERARLAPACFTEDDIRAAFAAGANWVRGAIEDGAAEYVEKLKGHK